MNTNDPNFFPMSKIPDLVLRMFNRVVSYDHIREMKDEGKEWKKELKTLKTQYLI